MTGEDEGEATHRWDNKGEGGTGGGYTLGRLVVRGDNMRFLTSRKSDSREAPRPVAPFPLVKSSRVASRLSYLANAALRLSIDMAVEISRSQNYQM